MALADGDRIARPTGRGTATHGHKLMAGILLAALIAALGIRHLVPVEGLAPAVVTLMFAGAAATAGVALLCRRERVRLRCFELAGGLTFIGVILSVLIEPDQLVRFASAPAQPE